MNEIIPSDIRRIVEDVRREHQIQRRDVYAERERKYDIHSPDGTYTHIDERIRVWIREE